MPGFVTPQPPRREDRSHAQAPLRAEHGEHGEDRTGAAALLGAAPKAGLNRRDLARHYTDRSAGARVLVMERVCFRAPQVHGGCGSG